MKLSQAHKSLIVICLGIALCYFKVHSLYLIIGSVALLILGASIKPFRELLHRLWMGLAKVMGWVMQPLVLGVLFFLILTPMAVLQRLFSKENYFADVKSKTTFKTINKTFQPEHFENPW